MHRTMARLAREPAELSFSALLIPPRSPVAVLLFTRSAGEDAARKQFVRHGSRAGNVAVAARLIGHARAMAGRTGVDFHCVGPARQTGTTFGERLAGALHQAFAEGYERLVVIGNDCPQLDVRLLRRAIADLATTGAVLGPATDGGVYLLGISRTYFEKIGTAAWAALPWQTANLGQALDELLRSAGATVPQLPLLADVDNDQDLAQVLRRPLARPLLRALWQLRSRAPRPVREPLAVPAQPAFAAAQPHRGPPNC